MVAGLIKFKEYFENYTDSYVLIGGAACDILFTQNDMDFRATRDLDMVLMDGRVIENGYSVLRPEYLILFKAKAYLDLSDRANRGEKIDLSDIKKHKKDVLRLTAEMILNPVFDLPQSIYDDIQLFITKIEEEEFDQNSLKTYRVTTEQVLARIRSIFGI